MSNDVHPSTINKWTLTATPALAAPLWRRCWSKGNTSLTAAATGSQCTKWKQVPLWPPNYNSGY